MRSCLLSISLLALTCAALSACESSSSEDDPGSAGSSSTGGQGEAGTGEPSSGGEIGAGGGDGACDVDLSYMPNIDPTNFVEGVDNPYWPLLPGTQWVFGGSEYIEVTVTDMSKEILGIPVVVVRDTVRDGGPDGDIVEDTYDWYAQDQDGNVWYMGEDTKEYEGGVVVSTAGSWEAGVDGAQPGIVMYGAPELTGEAYRQEYYACEAEDFAEALSLTETVSVPFGDFTDCIQTREFTPLEPDLNEHKYYCAGIGVVLIEDLTSGETVELDAMTEP